ncbi:type VI secretion system protein ImpK [Caballeronia hypogeia]|uniref:Type VI secretion system protein ImpK n=1 Tax=Caballeronia hypogeia TaxID=1777140 RepID=A0A158AD10_9BURK|nr:DotU family type IV/VI secretion system protein [Caballeronia hypogeia]SAK55609.1 type VI secretion system protein ImpK [Caballeronia hypogeia]
MNRIPSFSGGAALVDHAAGFAPSFPEGMRDLLRDTALFVANLSSGGAPEDFASLRKHCKEMIDEFGAALDRRGYAADVRDDAVMAQCALLDETALRHLSEQERPQWSAQPLQVETLRQHDTGERVFVRLDARMRERAPQVGLLECYAAILGLGFTGRYAIEGEAPRAALIGELNALIARLRPEGERPFIVDQPGRFIGDWLRRSSPWALATGACCIAFVTWFGWHLALDAQLAALLPGAIKQ